MSRTAAARTTTRSSPGAAAVWVVVVIAAIIGSLVYQLAPSSAPSSSPAPSGDHRGTTSESDGAVTEDDGVLPNRVTVFDDRYPGVARVDPDLLRALRAAATDAAGDGIRLLVNSGWRSRDYQDQLLREAVSQYGSRSAAARWVATADTSPHVAGDAIDIGPARAAAWLADHGAAYGLCRVYRNEPWHFELRLRAVDRGCPRPYADPTHDPRNRP